MYRKTSSQLTLLEPVTLIPGLLPDDDWSFVFRDKVLPLIEEKKFKHFFQEQGGAPNKSIRTQVSLLIFMGLEKLTWREAEFMFMRRIDWMNATCTDFGKAFLDHTTLFKFFQKLEKDDTAYKLFADLTSSFIQECNVSTKKQRVDSFFMLGWLAVLSRYGLFKETIRVFLQALRKHQPELYEQIWPELSKNYLKDEFDLTEKDKKKAQKKVKEMAQDLFLIKCAFENHEKIKDFKTFQTLKTVFEQQCIEPETTQKAAKERESVNASSSNGKKSESNNSETTDEHDYQNGIETKPEIEIREKPVGDKIVSSPHNTDAEYTRKRDKKVVGHKGFVTETCDPGNDVQFITDANLETAKHSDSKELPEILNRLEANDMKPEDLYGDAGFVNGETIIGAEQRDINLAGPSSGRAQDFDEFRKEDRSYDIADFDVEFEGSPRELKVLTCPEKHEPLNQNRSDKTGRMLVHFDRNICAECPTQCRCPIKVGARVATLDVSEQQYAGAERHHLYMGNEEYRKECGIRAGAESLVNEVANGHGARESNHKTEPRSKLQLIFSSIGCNVKRYIRHMQTCVQSDTEVAGIAR
jgi:hypothetical protein